MAAGRDNSLHSTSAGENSPILGPSQPPESAGSRLHSFFLPGPAGRLEALLNEPPGDSPFASIVFHPHPLGGGTMHNKVVYHAAKIFSAVGWPVLRFNFRGTGLSEWQHDGRAEIDDARAVIDWLTRQYARPIVAAGFSFGAAIGLEALSSDAPQLTQVQAFAAIGLPTNAEGRIYTYPFLSACRFPKLFLSGDRDQYAPVEQLRAIASAAPAPKQFELIEGADHFFTGHLPAMQSLLRQWLISQFPLTSSSFSPANSELEKSLS